MKVIEFSSFSTELLNFQIGRTRSFFKINQQTQHHFLGFRGQSVIWKHLKWCWMIPYAIYGGTTTPNLFLHNSEIQMCITFEPFFIYPNKLSIFKYLWSQPFIGKHLRRCLTCLVPIFAEYRSPHELDPYPRIKIWHSFSMLHHHPTNHSVFTTVLASYFSRNTV